MFFKRKASKKETLYIKGISIQPAPSFTRIGISPLERLTFIKTLRKAFENARIIKKKRNFYHVNYWYEGPVGHNGLHMLELLEKGNCQHSVIVISRLDCGDWSFNEPIVKKIIELSMVHNNYVILLETIAEDQDGRRYLQPMYEKEPLLLYK